MQSIDPPASSPLASRPTNKPAAHAPQFTAVRDSRNRRVPGLYVRNGRYYGQLWVDRGNGKKTARRFPLLNDSGKPASTLAEAKQAFEIKRHERRENTLPTGGSKPLFANYCETYFAKAKVQRKQDTRKRAASHRSLARALGARSY